MNRIMPFPRRQIQNLATKNHKSHKMDGLLNRAFELFVDLVPFRG